MSALAQRLNGALRPVPAWPLYPLGLVPAGWLWYLGFTGGLGPEPINALIRELGLLGLQFLVATLAVSPLRTLTGINLVRYRRALGLLCFYYVLQHLLVWLVLDIGDLARIWAGIVKRPYVTIGMGAFLCLLPLALTSNDWAVRRMGGAAWRRLHRLAYPASILAVAHYIWLVKGWPAEPFVYAGGIGLLLALRLLPKRRPLRG